MTVTSSFKIIESRFIPALQGTLTKAKHIRTGAEFIHLICPEELENSFAVCFRTPCTDDLGIPHMIEHIVLQGSEKYPLKDLYIELEKRCMATFAYGNTGSNRTVYLCGSNNTKQYMKLVSVYMDVVFHPILSEEMFQQEAYRLDFEISEDSGSNLIHNGVVYNEMKGIARDQFRYVVRKGKRSLSPDVSSGWSCDGDYTSIPEITYGRLIDYYNDHYHTANCCMFSITRVPFTEIAELLDSELSNLGSLRPPAEILPQTPFKQPTAIGAPMPGRDAGKCIALSLWGIPSDGDAVQKLTFSVLKDILCASDNSPLKSALVSSKFGTSFFHNYSQGFMQNDLSIGLYGVKKSDSQKVFQLIRNTLHKQVASGFNPEMINDLINRHELKQREKGDYWSESILWKVCAAWANSEDVMLVIDSNAVFSALRQKLIDRPKLFEEMISKHLLNNPHLLNSVFYPDEEYFTNIDLEVRKKLNNFKKSMSEEEIAFLAESSMKLKRYLEQPLNEAHVSSLPIVSASDIADFISPDCFFNEEVVKNKQIIASEINTSGICYIDLCFDVSELRADLIPHLAFYEDLLISTGAGNLDYQEVLAYEFSCSSGITASTLSISSSITSSDEYRIVFRVRGHCLPRDLSAMLSAIERRVFQPEFNNLEHILAIAKEMEEKRRGSVIYWGNELSLLMAKAALSTGSYYDNLLHGIPALQNCLLINKRTVESTVEALTAIHKYISEQAPQILVWSGPEKEYPVVAGWYKGLPGSREKMKHQSPPPIIPIPSQMGIETQSISSSVGMAKRSIPPNHALAASGVVAMEIIDEYLINEIMLKGGAYTGGGFMEEGALLYYSYRDPSPARSLSLFHEVANNCSVYIDSQKFSLDPYIISSVKKANPVLRPATANTAILKRFLRGESRNYREVWNRALLSVNKDSISEFCVLVEGIEEAPQICIISNDETLCSMNIEDRIYI